MIEKARSILATLVTHRFRLRADRRVAWLRYLWSGAGSEDNVHGTYDQEIDIILRQEDIPERETVFYQGLDDSFTEALQETETAIAAHPQSPLAHLLQVFELSLEEACVLQACWALSLEPELGRLCAYLKNQANRPFLTLSVIKKLYQLPTTYTIPTESPLLTWRLISLESVGPGEEYCLRIDPFIHQWLLQEENLDPLLIGSAHLKAAQKPLDSWEVAPLGELIANKLKQGQGVRMHLEGPPGSGRRSLAAYLAGGLGMPLLVLSPIGVPMEAWPTYCMCAYRQAFLDGCALAWQGEQVSARIWPAHFAPFPLQFIIGNASLTISSQPGLLDQRWTLPSLSAAETVDLFSNWVENLEGFEANEWRSLLQQYQLTLGQLRQLAQHPPQNLQALEDFLKQHAHLQLGQLAQPMQTPFELEDLVVGNALKEQLNDLIYEAEERRNIWELPELRRLFPQGRGLLALLTGPPGTGKTMTAQVVAAQLRLPLFRIDLSSVISKYVGETAKNLERILQQTKHMNVVLLFDEADALFGKRTEVKDAQDRFANTDTNFLLQAIEQFPGIAFLTSNKKGNIDYGFIRRLRYVLEFPRPDAQQRLQIWHRLLESMLGASIANDLAIEANVLAEHLELTGAQIKLIILSAYISAKKSKQVVGLPHLLSGVEREWRKEGRGLSQDLRKMIIKEQKRQLTKLKAS
ncbi:MAG: AAA family ATPase [Bacteroidota bacterium]